MSQKRRLDRLEKAIARLESERPPPRPAPLEWDGAVAEVGRLLDGGPGAEAVARYAHDDREFRRQMAAFWPPWNANGELDDPGLGPAALVLLFTRLPTDLRAAAATPAALVDPRGWARDWVRQLKSLTSRIPPGVAAEVLRRSVAAGQTHQRSGHELFACEGGTWALYRDHICPGCGLREMYYQPIAPNTPRHRCGHCGNGGADGASHGAAPGWAASARQEIEAVAQRLRTKGKLSA